MPCLILNFSFFSICRIFSRVNLEPKSRFKEVENGNYAVDLCKMMRFSMINVGGLDIVDGNKKLILAIIWQLMRK